jgi:hypothetical protein
MQTFHSKICVGCFGTWVLMNTFEAAITSLRKRVLQTFSIFSLEERRPNHIR